MAESKKHVVVIGAGPGGYPAAFHAADLGMEVTLIDPEENPGGVCLYRGCIPSKALLHAVKTLDEARDAGRYGLEFSDLKLNPDKLREFKDSVVEKLTGGVGQLCRQRQIEYLRGRAAFEDPHTLAVDLHDGDSKKVTFDDAVIATGSLPATIPPAIESERVISSRQALDIEDVPERLLVIGGGYIGLELGQVYAALGSKITVVEMLPALLAGVDADLVNVLRKRLKKQFDSILLETKAAKMEEVEEGVRVTFEGKNAPDEPMTFDKVMLAVGRRPNTEGLNPDKAGVELSEKGFVSVNAQRRTSQEHIFAVGDVAGEPMLAHKGTHEARVAAEAIAGKRTAFDPAVVPFVIFSDPEIAVAGLTEQQARAEERDAIVSKFPWSASGRALTIGRTDGLTKVIADRETHRVLGVGIAGADAGEMIAEAALAIEMGAVAEDIALTIHTHPTLGETLMEAAEGVSGPMLHFRGR